MKSLHVDFVLILMVCFTNYNQLHYTTRPCSTSYLTRRTTILSPLLILITSPYLTFEFEVYFPSYFLASCNNIICHGNFKLFLWSGRTNVYQLRFKHGKWKNKARKTDGPPPIWDSKCQPKPGPKPEPERKFTIDTFNNQSNTVT